MSQNKNVFEQIKEAQEQNSKFLKIDVGQTRTLSFDIQKIAVVEAEFQGQKKKRVRYTVIEPSRGLEEKWFELSLTHAGQLNALLQKNLLAVEITRTAGGRDTKYTFVPIVGAGQK